MYALSQGCDNSSTCKENEGLFDRIISRQPPVSLDRVLEQRVLSSPRVSIPPPAKTYESHGYVGIYDTIAPDWHYWHLHLHLPFVTGQLFHNVQIPYDGYWYCGNYFLDGVTFMDSGQKDVAFVGGTQDPNIFQQAAPFRDSTCTISPRGTHAPRSALFIRNLDIEGCAQ